MSTEVVQGHMLKLVLLAFGVALALPSLAAGSTIVFGFTGRVTGSSTFPIGTPITGTYAFESTTPGVAVGLPPCQRYPAPILSSGIVGSLAFSITPDAGWIDVCNDRPYIPLSPRDSYGVAAVQDGADVLLLQVIDSEAGILTSDALPTVPPDLAAAEFRSIDLLLRERRSTES